MARVSAKGRGASSTEKVAERWYRDNGFECVVVKRTWTESTYEISRGGLREIAYIPFHVEHPVKYTETLRTSWNLHCQIEGREDLIIEKKEKAKKSDLERIVELLDKAMTIADRSSEDRVPQVVLDKVSETLGFVSTYVKQGR